MSVDDTRLLVNKRELARILGCSLPTLDAAIARYGDAFPVERRGNAGAAWQFDAAGVVAFLEAQRAEERAAAQARAALFDQFTLPLSEAEADQVAVTPADRERIAKARMLEHKLAIEARFLVPVAEMRQGLTTVMTQLGRWFDALPRRLASKCGLGLEVERQLEHELAELRTRLVDDIETALKGKEQS